MTKKLLRQACKITALGVTLGVMLYLGYIAAGAL